MGTYVATTNITPAFREAHFQALKRGGKLPEEFAPIVEAHTQYVKDLKAKGKMLAGGPTVAFTWGVSLLKTDSLEEAIALSENDPAVKNGLFTDLKVEAWYHIV